MLSGINTRDEDLPFSAHGRKFKRVFGRFGSFAVAFSFISVTTGIFTTFEELITGSGPRGIWLWPVVVLGQTLVALVYGELAAKIPVAGYSYQWACRMDSPHLGWWLGWLSLASVAIVTVAVDWIFVTKGLCAEPFHASFCAETSHAPLTIGVIGIQMVIIMASSRITALLNDAAVWTEVIGILVICGVLLGWAMYHSTAKWENLTATSGDSWMTGWPLILALLPGAYTLTGFESSSNMIEETRDPRRIVPRVMWQSVVCSGGLGMIMLVTFASTIPNGPQQNGLVWAIIREGSRPWFANFFVWPVVCVSMFACGLVMLLTNTRLLYVMACDRRLPGHQFLAKVPQRWGTPVPAIGTVALLSGVIVVILRLLKGHRNTEVISAATLGAILMAAILYTLTLLLYVKKGRKYRTEQSYFQLGRWRWPVVVAAGAWLLLELAIFFYPVFQATRLSSLPQSARVFCEVALVAQLYAVCVAAVGLFVYLLLWWLEPAALSLPRNLVQSAAKPAE